MCGIIGYIGKRKALPILIHGLKSMEYRGYDSSGISIIEPDGAVKSDKAVGKVINLEEKIAGETFDGTIGCGHERWATHGGVTELNAHPHSDCTNAIWLVHNGIVENYKELKEELIKKGHSFKSETDTEAIAHLIEEAQKQISNIEDAVRSALKQIKGTYGLIIIDSREKNKIIAARNFSPLILGIGDGEYFIASDSSAIIKYTTKVIYLEDGEMAVLNRDNYTICDLEQSPKEKNYHTIEWTMEEAQKGGFPHFMLKEIYDEPTAILNSIRGRLIEEQGLSKLGGLSEVLPQLRNANRILIAACGTSYLAGKVGEYMLEEYAEIPAEVEYSSEFRYRKPVFFKNDVLIAISQSGETADTLAAVIEAKEKGILTLGIVNVVGSTIARETDAGVYQHIGPEISVASTKAFTSHVSILTLLTLLFGRSRQMSLVTGQRIAHELKLIPDKIKEILENQQVEEIAKKYLECSNFFFLGRKYNFPVACEGALKIKEVSYVHAEGYGAGELKHGPIAMIDKNFPSVAIAPQDSVYEKMISNIEEIKARGGKILAIGTQGDARLKEVADDVIYIPKTLEMLTPLLSIIPLQLLAYYSAILKGFDVDKPRNLAKSVTVE